MKFVLFPFYRWGNVFREVQSLLGWCIWDLRSWVWLNNVTSNWCMRDSHLFWEGRASIATPIRAGETEPGKDSSQLPRFSQSASDSTKTRAWIFLLMVQASIELFSGHLLKSWVNATWLPCWFLFRWWGFPKAGESQRAARLSPASG